MVNPMRLKAIMLTVTHKESGKVMYRGHMALRGGAKLEGKPRTKVKSARTSLEKTVRGLGHEIEWIN